MVYYYYFLYHNDPKRFFETTNSVINIVQKHIIPLIIFYRKGYKYTSLKMTCEAKPVRWINNLYNGGF